MDRPSNANTTDDSSRRNFLKEMSAFPLLAMFGGRLPFADLSKDPSPNGTRTTTPATKEKFVAIQIGARSFMDEGVDRVLDDLQEKAGVNLLMPAVFTYGRGLAGRQTPGQPLPDHGVQQYDEIHGGSYSKLRPEFYINSVIKDFRAPELVEFDILADVTPK